MVNRSLTLPAGPQFQTRTTNPEATLAFRLPDRLRADSGLQRPFAQHAVAYAAMRAVAQAISSIPFLVRVGRDEEDEEILRDGPWVQLFDRVNPVMSNRTEFWERTVLHLLSNSGECVWVKEGEGDERIGEGEIPTEFWPLNGKFFEPVLDEHTKLPILWLYHPPEVHKPVPYQPHELVILKFPNPESILRGLGPTAPGTPALRADYKAQRYNEKFFDNDASPGGMLVAQRPLNAEQRDRIIETWRERHEGTEKRSRIGLLEGGLDYKPTGINQRDMEFGNLRHTSWSELMMVYGVTEFDLGLSENINRSVAEVIERRFVTKTLLPIIRLIEDGAWEQLFKPVEGDSGTPGRARRTADYRLTEARGPRYSRKWDKLKTRWAVHDTRKLTSYSDLRPHPEPKRKPKTGVDVWGEFDLTTVAALRDNLAEIMDNANKAVQMGVPFNEVNARFDLGFQPQPHGDIPFMSANMVSVDNLLMPEEPDPAPEPKSPTPKPPSDSDENSESDQEASGTEGLTAEQRAQAIEWLTRRPKDRDAKWRRFLRALVPLEMQFRRKFTHWLHDLLAHQLKRVSRAGETGRTAAVRAPDDKLTSEEAARAAFLAEEWARKLATMTHAVYVSAATEGVKLATEDLGATFKFDVVDPRVVDIISQRERVLVKASETIQRRVAKTLQAGVTNGETIHEIQDRLRADFKGFSAGRALTIARTEVASTVNESRNLVFQAEGVEKHEWITARDEAVRGSHAAQDGQVVPIGTPFANGVMYPGDPRGAPSEVINCRCVVIPVLSEK